MQLLVQDDGCHWPAKKPNHRKSGETTDHGDDNHADAVRTARKKNAWGLL